MTFLKRRKSRYGLFRGEVAGIVFPLGDEGGHVGGVLGHGSTDITEKVYAHFLPETLSSELNKLSGDLTKLEIF